MVLQVASGAEAHFYRALAVFAMLVDQVHNRKKQALRTQHVRSPCGNAHWLEHLYEDYVRLMQHTGLVWPCVT